MGTLIAGKLSWQQMAGGVALRKGGWLVDEAFLVHDVKTNPTSGKIKALLATTGTGWLLPTSDHLKNWHVWQAF